LNSAEIFVTLVVNFQLSVFWIHEAHACNIAIRFKVASCPKEQRKPTLLATFVDAAAFVIELSLKMNLGNPCT
jgi:hypothetical protein